MGGRTISATWLLRLLIRYLITGNTVYMAAGRAESVALFGLHSALNSRSRTPTTRASVCMCVCVWLAYKQYATREIKSINIEGGKSKGKERDYTLDQRDSVHSVSVRRLSVAKSLTFDHETCELFRTDSALNHPPIEIQTAADRDTNTDTDTDLDRGRDRDCRIRGRRGKVGNATRDAPRSLFLFVCSRSLCKQLVIDLRHWTSSGECNCFVAVIVIALRIASPHSLLSGQWSWSSVGL